MSDEPDNKEILSNIPTSEIVEYLEDEGYVSNTLPNWDEIRTIYYTGGRKAVIELVEREFLEQTGIPMLCTEE